MPRKKKLAKKVEEKIEVIVPEKKKVKKVEIREITQKIPSNAKFSMIIAVAILWVGVIRLGFLRFFEYFFPLPNLAVELIIATIVTLVVLSVFKSWTKISRRLGKIRVKIKVKPRVNNHGNNKKRR